MNPDRRHQATTEPRHRPLIFTLIAAYAYAIVIYRRKLS